MLKAIRYGAWAAVAAIALMLAAVAVVWYTGGRAPDVTSIAQIGGPFTLVDQNGKTVTEKDLIGRPTLLFFGYTHCPDACPTTMSDLTALMQKIGPDADRLNVFFVTVDPERDTREALADYAKAFDPRFRLLTGTPEQIKQVVSGYRVFVQKTAGEGSDYVVNHSSSVYLLDRNGKFAGTLAYQEPENAALMKVKRLIAA